MAISKAAKVEAEICKVKDKLAELQTRLRELEQKKTEIENSEIVGVVRNMNIPLDQLATLLTAIRDGGVLTAPAPGTSTKASLPPAKDKDGLWGVSHGQNVQSSADLIPDKEEDTEE